MKIVTRLGTHGYIDRWLWVPKQYISVDATKKALTHVLTDSYTGKDRFLYLWRETAHHLILPRAFWDPANLPFTVVDCRPTEYTEVNFSHNIKLDHKLVKDISGTRLVPTGESIQKNSYRALSAVNGGTLQLGCGKGKTVIALYKIAMARVPAIVICDNTNLLYQWKQEAEKMLTVPSGIGVFGDGKKDWRKGLVLATYHSVANWADTITEEERRWFGGVYWDEGHHIGAPTFLLTADIFYGDRYSLTATPSRDDGMHIISKLHIGDVLYKDLRPTMPIKFSFLWTGLSLDLADPTVSRRVLDTNNELHLSKVSSYLGSWVVRLKKIIDVVRIAREYGRVAMVLSNSVAEVVNLMALYELGDSALANMYSDIPVPTPQDIGETLTPKVLTARERNKLLGSQSKLQKALDSKKATKSDIEHIKSALVLIDTELKRHALQGRLNTLLAKRQRDYLIDLLGKAKTSGIITYDTPKEHRAEALATKDVIFAITKYGKEALNCPRLDLVVVSSLFSSRNGLQQLIGRPTRPMPGKKSPVIISLVDNIGPCIGMSKKLVSHLVQWPANEGGPHTPYFIDYPGTWKSSITLPSILEV